MSDFVAESGHWYTRAGAPAYTQIIASGKSKGKERPTTIRDARKHNLLPSVTTIIDVLDKPALTNWKCNRAREAALWETYQWMMDCAPQVAEKFQGEYGLDEPDTEDKAGRGSEIHAALEQWLGGGGIVKGYESYIIVLEEVMDEYSISITDVVPERSFASTHGFGGAVDFSTNSGQPFIIDFKTKDMNATQAKEVKAYDNHIMQLGAYRIGLGLPGATLINLFLSRNNPDVYKVVEWSEEDAKWGEQAFLDTFQTWKSIKRYDPNGYN